MNELLARKVVRDFVNAINDEERENLRYHLTQGTVFASSNKIFDDEGGA